MKNYRKAMVLGLLMALLPLLAACAPSATATGGEYQSRYFSRGSFGQISACGHYGCSVDY